MDLADAQKYADIIKNIATALGVVAAAGYFLFKAMSGHEILNLKLSVQTRRQPKENSDTDYLAIEAAVAKGDRASVQIHDAQVRVTVRGKSKTLPLEGVERLSIQRTVEGEICRQVVLWGTRSKQATFLSLTPGEETEFSCLTEVPRDEPCLVEVVFLGQRPNSVRLGQWRASHISLPNPKRNQSAAEA